MADILTDADLAAIRERVNAATPGPWVKYDMDDETSGTGYLNGGKGWWWVWREAALPWYGGVFEVDQDYDVKGTDGRLYKVAGAVGPVSINDGSGTPQEIADAEFIAHARTDVPALLAYVDHLQAEVQRARELQFEATDEAGLANITAFVYRTRLKKVLALCDRADAKPGPDGERQVNTASIRAIIAEEDE